MRASLSTATDYQSHSGAVNTSTSPKVQYGYADGSANTIRPTSLTYPDTRAISYNYGTSSGMNDLLGRLAAIKESTDSRAAYSYLGLGTIVQIDESEPSVKMTYIKQGAEPVGDAGDQYIGLDRFGRLVDSRWIDSTPADINRVQYGYSAVSNKVWRQNMVQTTGQDEYYTYDGLYQLDDLQRGTLNGTNTGISGTPDWEEDFTYDPIGNWQNYLTNVSGSTTLDQDRTQSKVNETTSIASSSSFVAYDKAGNMTTAPQPVDWGSGYTLTWDAWNRPVSTSSGGSPVATYAYDGLNRRTIKDTGTAQHYYYSKVWQILEERAGSSTSADRQFLWGRQGIDDLVFRDTFSGSTQRFYAMGDGMSITAIGDTSGSVQERYGYNAFGNVNFMDASFGSISSSSYGWETLFCGYRWDSETGFYQVRYRYLHAQLGRWLSRDPIGEKAGMNLYAYVGNNTTDLVDTLGLREDDYPNSETPGGNGYNAVYWISTQDLKDIIKKRSEESSKKCCFQSVTGQIASVKITGDTYDDTTVKTYISSINYATSGSVYDIEVYFTDCYHEQKWKKLLDIRACSALLTEESIEHER